MNELLAIDSAVHAERRLTLREIDELHRARAAIAELIEADREFDAAERELNDDTLTSDEKSAVSWPRYYAARERRAAALRAVGGAK